MNPANYIAIYLPLFIIFFIILPSNRKNMFLVRKLRKRRGEKVVTNEMIKSCIGKICTITTSMSAASYSKVEIVEVVDNWIKVQAKGKTNIVNIDYIQNIKIHN